MRDATVKTPAKKDRPAKAAAQSFWEASQKLESALQGAAVVSGNTLLEGAQSVSTRPLDAADLRKFLDSLSAQLGSVRMRLGKSDQQSLPSSARRHAEQNMAKLAKEGELMLSSEFVKHLGFSRQALSKALTANRVFYVDIGPRRYFPSFFVDPRYQRRQLEQVSQSLGGLPGASKLQFFLTRKASLAGLTPLDALADGKYAQVKVAAQGFAER